MLTAFLSFLRDWMRLDSEFFRQSNFRFVINFLKATEAGKGKPVDWKGAYFTDCRICFQGRSTAFSMNQDKHVALLLAAKNCGKGGTSETCTT